MTKKTKKKYKPTERMKHAQENLEDIAKRISPYTKPSKSKMHTTEGQWCTTHDNMLD